MTLITTVAELDVLPEGAVVLDKDGDAWHKKATGRWAVGEHLRSRGAPPEHLVETWGPLATVAASSPELRSTRCCGHDCHDTALLRPGSTYLCPDHGDCSADIRKEQATNEH